MQDSSSAHGRPAALVVRCALLLAPVVSATVIATNPAWAQLSAECQSLSSTPANLSVPAESDNVLGPYAYNAGENIIVALKYYVGSSASMDVINSEGKNVYDALFPSLTKKLAYTVQVADSYKVIITNYSSTKSIVTTFTCDDYLRPIEFFQLGTSPLIGSGVIGSAAQQGHSVALSADGNTAIIGGWQDNGGIGAAWVYTRSAGVWTQQAKLIGASNVGASGQGWSVALSNDGNTAAVGGYEDNSFAGAVWIFTRSNGTWTQQGQKLVGSGGSASAQGYSVALSGDGNTLLEGGYIDNPGAGPVGASWVFTRNNSTWTQQGQKLVGSGYVGGTVYQGYSVSLSIDGNTALIGGPQDNSSAGAAWIFTRSGGTWTQLGQKLVGGNASGSATAQGTSVALSGDGNTAILGGPGDNSSQGAAWVFTQSGGTWTQQGSKLVGTGSVGNPAQGSSVNLSMDGNIAVFGGPNDNAANQSTEGEGTVWVFYRSSGSWAQQWPTLDGGGSSDLGASVALSADGYTLIAGDPQNASGAGAAWVFVRSNAAATHDFNGDGVSDILWRDTSGDLAMWLMSAGQMASGATISQVSNAWSVVGQRDFNGNGDADILWLDSTGDLAVWLMNGTTLSSGIGLGNVGTSWKVVGTGDFNGDGTGDILWRDGSGDLAIWLMSNGQFASGVSLGQVSTDWSLAGTGDFNGDGTTDILWYNTQTGDVAIWLLNNGQLSSGIGLGNVGTSWTVVGTGDFNGDGTSDILWRDSSGDLAMWLMSNGQFSSGATIAQVSNVWSVAETGDFNGDGKSDILWVCATGGGSCSVGDVAVWLMNGTSLSSGIGLGNVGTSWQVQGKNAD